MLKKRKMNEESVVGVVVTVLLIGLVVSVIMTINTLYVPHWIEEQEAEHMDQVMNQFASFKQHVDLQAMIDQQTAISSWFTLGSKEIPIMSSGRTFGQLTIHQNEYNITINNDVEDSAPVDISTGTIKFESGNNYYVPQSFVYENGALILEQYTSNLLIGKPTFFVTTYGQNLSFTIIDLNGSIGKRIASGYGVTSVQTKVIEVEEIEIPLVTNITIHTKYPQAWVNALNSTLNQVDSGFQFSDDRYDIQTTVDSLMLSFYADGSSTIYPTIDVKKVTVFTQIAPGWIE